MRLLHSRYADDLGGVSARQSRPDRGGGAGRNFRQFVPLHRLSQHRRGCARRCKAIAEPQLTSLLTPMNHNAASLLLLIACALPSGWARADEEIKLAIGARGNWETAAAELGQKAGFFRKRGLTLDLLYTQGS